MLFRTRFRVSYKFEMLKQVQHDKTVKEEIIMNKSQSAGIWIVIVLIVAALGAMLFAGSQKATQELSYTNFLKKVENHEIVSVLINQDSLLAEPKDNKLPEPKENNIEPIFKPANLEMPTLQYKVMIPSNDDTLYKKLEDNNVEIKIGKPSDGGLMNGIWGSAIFSIIFLVIIMVFFAKMIQSAGGSQAMNFGKSKAKMMLDSKVKITFKDVAGIDEERQELEEIVDFLKHSDKYMKLGAKIPKGVLLVGAPGTGKTLMAKAVAGEAGVPFFSISGSDFVEMFVGVGASRVRDLFEQAKKHQPCIIFIDEIDAVGRQRGAGLGGGHDEREQTLNQLLVEMDGFDENTNIIIIAATNRPDILDTALLRPGRFDRQIAVSAPDIKGREEILKVHAKNKPLGKDVDLKILAKRTSGFTGADLQNLLNEASLLAARNNKNEINMEEVDYAIDRVIAGIEKKSRVMTDEDKEITAYHEVGHALLAKLIPGSDVMHKVSIIPRGMALGLTWFRPKDESVSVKRSKLMARLVSTLGGRAAEELIYGKDNITTGASQDIKTATQIARKMVTQWGMSEKMGNMVYGKSDENVFLGRDFGHTRDFSEEIAADLDKEVKAIIDERYALALKLLSENKDMLDTLSRELLDKETIDEKEFDEIMARVENERNY